MYFLQFWISKITFIKIAPILFTFFNADFPYFIWNIFPQKLAFYIFFENYFSDWESAPIFSHSNAKDADFLLGGILLVKNG